VIRRHLHLFGLSVLLLSVAAGSSVSKQMKDFHVFRDVLLEKEGTLDLHHDESVFRTALSMAEKNFEQPHTLLEQFKLYSLTLSVLECGHTQIHPNSAALKEWLKARKALPLDYYLYGRKLFVAPMLPEDLIEMNKEQAGRVHKNLPSEGAEILEIDGLTVEEMMHEIGLFLSSDENGIDFKYFQAKNVFEFYRHLALPLKGDSIEIRYVEKKDTQYLMVQTGRAPVFGINARLKKSFQEFAARDNDFGQFKVREGLGYFRFTSFKVSNGKRYEAFLKKAFTDLRRKKIKKLVVDLRGNTGGVMQFNIMRYFVGADVELGSYVIEKPKSIRDDSHFKKWSSDYMRHSAGSRLQKRRIRKGRFDDGKQLTQEVDSNLIYRGKIVVITDEGTFSAASILAGHLRHFCDAKIVGRPAGGSFYCGNAGTLRLILPHSKFSVFVNPNTFRSSLPAATDPFQLKQPDVWIDVPYKNQKKDDEYYFRAAKKSFKE
jgi:C-terminal processing protease CtpA/Prc